MRGYHYTKLENWNAIISNKTPLQPRGYIVNPWETTNNLPPEATDRAIFGLLSAEPFEWTQNKEFKHMWDFFLGCVSSGREFAMISFELSSSDNAYVFDWAHKERYARKMDWKTKDAVIIEKYCAIERYWKSRTALSDYNGGHHLPELVILNPISFDRLKLEQTFTPRRVVERRLLA